MGIAPSFVHYNDVNILIPSAELFEMRSAFAGQLVGKGATRGDIQRRQ